MIVTSGGGQLLWSQQMSQFAGVVVRCPGLSPMGDPYPIPFLGAVPATGKLA